MLIPLGERFQFTVQTRDLDGRECVDGRAPLNAQAEDGEGSQVQCDVRDYLDGTYSVSFTPASTGQHRMHVRLGSKRYIRGAPFDLNVSAPSFDDATPSSDAAPPARASNNGKFVFVLFWH